MAILILMESLLKFLTNSDVRSAAKNFIVIFASLVTWFSFTIACYETIAMCVVACFAFPFFGFIIVFVDEMPIKDEEGVCVYVFYYAAAVTTTSKV